MSDISKSVSAIDLEQLIASLKKLPIEVSDNKIKIKRVRKTVEAWYAQIGAKEPVVRQKIETFKISADSAVDPIWQQTNAGKILLELFTAFQFDLEDPTLFEKSIIDLGADSMDAIEMIMFVEDKLNVELTDEQSESLSKLTLGQLYNTLNSFIAET